MDLSVEGGNESYMINLNEKNLIYNKESIYNELKEFHDTHLGALYSYQDFEIAGMREFKSVSNKIRPLKEYEKNRLTSELIKILKEAAYNEDQNVEKINGYLTLNPIINYYDNLIKALKALKESEANIAKKLKALIYNILLNSSSSEEVKLALTSVNIFDFKEIENILEVFSIHNEYVFYVIKIYENMKNGNELIFEVAKNSKGYGKLFSMMALQPINYEIKNWMINYGPENNVGTSELVMYSMLSIDLLDYLENNDFNEKEIELFSKSFCMLLSDYGLDEIDNQIEVCEKLLRKIDENGRGIYSLYAAISIMYSIEALILEDYKSNNESTSNTFEQEYKDAIECCIKIFNKTIWNEVIYNEISNIEIETSILISCAEKTEYKLKKSEFELILKRDYTNPLLYKYAFSVGNKSLKKYAFKLGLEKLPIDELLSGQDELKIEDLLYDDISQISFFIIVKYATYEDFPDKYKEFNLKALKSPLIETRMEALNNLEGLKDKLDYLDQEIIKDSINTEMITTIRRRLNLLLIKDESKEKRYVEIKNIKIVPHVKDIYLTSVNISGTKYVDMSEVCDKLYEDDIVYLKREPNNPYDIKAIQVVTVDGYVIGYIPKEENFMLKNLMDNGKYLYGIVRRINDDYEAIRIRVYLSYKDIIDEITNTLSLLSGGKEDYVQ